MTTARIPGRSTTGPGAGEPDATTRRAVVAEIAATRAQRAIAALVGTTAARLVRLWGLVSATAVIQRAHALGPWPVTDETTRAVLDDLPHTHWMDDEREWFTLPDPHSRLVIALGKVFAIANRVRLDDLRYGLAKALPGAGAAPAGALRAYLTRVAGCVFEETQGETFVRATARLRRHRPTRREAALVRLLGAEGGALDLESLRRRARAAALPRTTVSQLIQSSPLFLSEPRESVRVIGDGQLAAYA
jgi:hypothetical protein